MSKTLFSNPQELLGKLKSFYGEEIKVDANVLKKITEFGETQKTNNGLAWDLIATQSLYSQTVNFLFKTQIDDVEIELSISQFINEKLLFSINIKHKQAVFINKMVEYSTVQAACLEAVRLLKEKVDNWHNTLKRL